MKMGAEMEQDLNLNMYLVDEFPQGEILNERGVHPVNVYYQFH